MIKQIISGGQTGVDLGALYGAIEIGIKTGGAAPRGWLNENGRQEQLMRSFGMYECSVPGYPARSMKNVDKSDGTIAIMWNVKSPGTAKTIGYAQTKRWVWFTIDSTQFYKPVYVITTHDTMIGIKQLIEFINKYDIKILNVAGHRESSQPGIQEFTKNLIIRLAD